MTLFIENSQYVRLSTLEKHSDHTVEEWLSSWQYIEVKRELFDHPCYPKVQVIIVVDILTIIKIIINGIKDICFIFRFNKCTL